MGNTCKMAKLAPRCPLAPWVCLGDVDAFLSNPVKIEKMWARLGDFLASMVKTCSRRACWGAAGDALRP